MSSSLIDHILIRWGIPKKFLNSDNIPIVSNSVQKFLDRFLSEFPNNKKGLFIYEKAGSKVDSFHLCCIFIKKLVSHKKIKKKAFFIQVPDLMVLSNISFEQSSSDYIKMREGVEVSDILIINDIGSEELTSSQRKSIYSFTHYCYRNSKPIIFTAQQSLDKIEQAIGSSMAQLISKICDFIEI